MKSINILLSVSLVLPFAFIRADEKKQEFDGFKQSLVSAREREQNVQVKPHNPSDLKVANSDTEKGREDTIVKANAQNDDLELREKVSSGKGSDKIWNFEESDSDKLESTLNDMRIRCLQAEAEFEQARKRRDKFKSLASTQPIPDAGKVLANLEAAVAAARAKYEDAEENYKKMRNRVRGNPSWVKRGCSTFLYAPCNFGRTFETVENACESKGGGEGYNRLLKIVSTPVVLCFEAIPTSCDLGNGLLDLVSFGAYGDFIYSDAIEPCWDKRNNRHFPWLDGARASFQRNAGLFAIAREGCLSGLQRES